MRYKRYNQKISFKNRKPINNCDFYIFAKHIISDKPTDKT